MLKKSSEKSLQNISGGKIYRLIHSHHGCEYGRGCNLRYFNWFVGKDNLQINNITNNSKYYLCNSLETAIGYEKLLNGANSRMLIRLKKLNINLHNFLSEVGVCHRI